MLSSLPRLPPELTACAMVPVCSELGDMKADMSSLTSRVSLLNERIAVFVRRNGESASPFRFEHPSHLRPSMRDIGHISGMRRRVGIVWGNLLSFGHFVRSHHHCHHGQLASDHLAPIRCGCGQLAARMHLRNSLIVHVDSLHTCAVAPPKLSLWTAVARNAFRLGRFPKMTEAPPDLQHRQRCFRQCGCEISTCQQDGRS